MNVRNYSLALIVGSFVSTLALAQAPAATASQPVEKSAMAQPKTEVKHKDAVASTAATTTEKSTANKAGKTHDKHVAKAAKSEESKSMVTKKEETTKSIEKPQDLKPSTTQSSSK